MKKSIIILMVLLSVSTAAQAKKLDWSGVSVLTMVSGGVPVVEDELKVTFGLTSLWFSKPGSFTIFGDAGVSWTATDWLWVSPQVGAVGGWAGSKQAFTTRLLAGLSFFKGQLSTFHIFRFVIMEQAEFDLFMFHAVDYSPLSWFSLGVHSESIDKLAWFGPHIGLTAGHFRGEIHWQAGGDLKSETYGHQVRFVTSLSF